MKHLFTLLCICVFNITHSQGNWVFLQTDLTGEYDAPDSAISMFNKKNDHVAIFLQLKNKARAYLINDKQELKNEISLDKMPRERNFSGYTIHQNRYKLYFTDASKTAYSSITINYGNNTFAIKKDELKIKKANIVSSFYDDNVFYILTLPKKEDYFVLYILGENGLQEEKKITFNHEQLVNDEGKTLTLKKALYKYQAVQAEFITNDVPSSIETTSKPNKLYWDSDKKTARLTMDTYDRFTYVLTMDIANEAYFLKAINHADIEGTPFYWKSNSFLLDNYILSLISTKKETKLKITNLDTNTIINSYSIVKDQPITFKNSPITQLYDPGNGRLSTKKRIKDIEKTNKFLRKMMAGKLGVSAYNQGENIIISIGGTQESANTNPIAPMFGIAGVITSNILLNAYSGYSSTNSVYFNSLMAKDFKHLKGDIPQHAFDKMIDFTKGLNKVKAPTVFKYKDNYIWGAFTPSAAFYRLAIF